MLENIEVMRMAHAMAAHAGQRQALTAQNIAQADTPGYRTQDLSPFVQTYKSAEPLTATRAGHLGAEARTRWAVQSDPQARASPNGNDVSLEREMLRNVEIRQQHDTALAIYRSTMNVLRTSLGRGR